MDAGQITELVQGPLADEEIVEAVLAGATDLFEVLMRRHNQRVYRAVRAVVLDAAEAEDVMQQAYVAAYAHLAEFRRQARFSTWLVRIAFNQALARAKRPGHLVPIGDVAEDAQTVWRSGEAPNPEERASKRELLGWIEEAVERLPDIYRVVFMLREIEGMDTAETAAVLGVSDPVIKTRLHRAKGLLRQVVQARMERLSNEAFPFAAAGCDRVVQAVLEVIAAAAPDSAR